LSPELKIKIEPLTILDGQFLKEVAQERNNPGVLGYLQPKIFDSVLTSLVEEFDREFL
jgi:hypothetical protein